MIWCELLLLFVWVFLQCLYMRAWEGSTFARPMSCNAHTHSLSCLSLVHIGQKCFLNAYGIKIHDTFQIFKYVTLKTHCEYFFYEHHGQKKSNPAIGKRLKFFTTCLFFSTIKSHLSLSQVFCSYSVFPLGWNDGGGNLGKNW